MNDEIPASLVLFLMTLTGILLAMLVNSMLRGDTVFTLLYGAVTVLYVGLTAIIVTLYVGESLDVNR